MAGVSVPSPFPRAFHFVQPSDPHYLYDDLGALVAVKTITTEIVRGPDDVRLLKHALLNGDSITERPALPSELVTKILDAAEYWAGAAKKSRVKFDVQKPDLLFFEFGPLPGRPKRVTIRIESCNRLARQNSRLGERPLSAPWSGGEVDVRDGYGRSKLRVRQRIFSHPPGGVECRVHTAVLRHLHKLGGFDKGDSIQFFLRNSIDGQCIHVCNAEMAVFYEPELTPEKSKK